MFYIMKGKSVKFDNLFLDETNFLLPMTFLFRLLLI